MNTTISNNGLPPFTPPPSGAGNSASASSGAVSNAGHASNAKADDQVQLTDSALALQRAAGAGEGAPINQQKIEQIRAALADGSYQVNPSTIADRMLNLEQQMSSAKV